MAETNLIKVIQAGYNLPIEYFKAQINKAQNVEEILGVMDLEQLTDKRFEQFYVQTDEIRGQKTTLTIEKFLKNPLVPYSKLLFSGFTGAGKTTELIKLAYNLKDQFNIVIFSVLNKLKIDELTIESVILEIAEDVLNYIALSLPIDETDTDLKEICAKILAWFRETITITEEIKENNKTIGVGIDFLKGLFISAKADTKITGTTKNQSVINQKQKLNDLVFECNRLFDYIRKKTGSNTIIIIDDLEKVPYLTARDFYLKSAGLIKGLRCHMLMTIPVELVFHSDFAPIEGIFGEAEVLPMIKVREKAGKPFKEEKAAVCYYE